MPISAQSIINAEHIFKSFKVGVQQVEILKDVSLRVQSGDFLVIFGSSGSGKSTLLHVLLGLEPPTKGTVHFLQTSMYPEGGTEDDRSSFRKKHIGMVYQQANWIKSLSVKENVSFPLLLLGVSKPEAEKKALEYLDQVEMSGWAEYKPTELSGGQQQRISLARAMVHNPSVLIADEPTGNLDYESGIEMMELLQQLNKEYKKTIIMVTHDLEYLKYATTAVKIFDGKVAEYYEHITDELIKSIRLKRISI